jgi:hypothetical protein
MKSFNSLSRSIVFSTALIFCSAPGLHAQWSGSIGPTGAVYREGNVGIGAGLSTPSSLLHLLGGDVTLQYSGTTSANVIFSDAANVAIGSIGAAGSKLVFATGATGSTGAGIIIDGSNNVGIGTASPTALLHVNGTLKANVLEVTGFNSPTHYELKVAGYDIGKLSAYGLSIGDNVPLNSGMGNFVMGSGNELSYLSTMSFVSGFENTSQGIENFIHGYQNVVSCNGLLGLNFALGGNNYISQSGSLLSQGLNFSLGNSNRIESEGEAGVNYTLGIDNLIENNAEAGGNFIMGIENDISYDNNGGNGGNFAIGYANKIGVTPPGGDFEGTPGINFLTGVANSIEGGSAACFGWGAGLGFNNTFGSFSIGLSSGIAGGTGSATYLQNDIPKSLMVGFSDDATLFVKDGHVGINTTTEGSALYVNGRTGAYGYSVVSAVNNDYGKAFVVHNKANSPTEENFRIYGNGETNITVNDDAANAFSISKRGSSSTVDNFKVNGKGEVEAKRIKIGDVTTPSGNDYTLYVEKGILAERFKCALKSTADWSDFVFD